MYLSQTLSHDLSKAINFYIVRRIQKSTKTSTNAVAVADVSTTLGERFTTVKPSDASLSAYLGGLG